MRWRYPIAPIRGPPDPVLVYYSVIDDSINRVNYIVCLHGRVPKRYEPWSLNAQEVREVHLFAWIWLLDDFRADTFQTIFFNSQRCCIPYIGRRLLNGSIEFIRANVTSYTEVFISTPNLFVHEWGTNPTILWPTVSNFTQRAYAPITSQKGFRQR